MFIVYLEENGTFGAALYAARAKRLPPTTVMGIGVNVHTSLARVESVSVFSCAGLYVFCSAKNGREKKIAIFLLVFFP